MNDMNGNGNQNTDNNQEMGGFARAVEFCKRNVQYIAVAGLFIVLVIVLVNVMGGKGTGSKTTNQRAHMKGSMVLAAYVAEDGLVGHPWEERPLVP